MTAQPEVRHHPSREQLRKQAYLMDMDSAELAELTMNPGDLPILEHLVDHHELPDGIPNVAELAADLEYEGLVDHTSTDWCLTELGKCTLSEHKHRRNGS